MENSNILKDCNRWPFSKNCSLSFSVESRHNCLVIVVDVVVVVVNIVVIVVIVVVVAVAAFNKLGQKRSALKGWSSDPGTTTWPRFELGPSDSFSIEV